MWANSVWGLLGLGVTFAMGRVGMIWTQGHEWIGVWLTRASVLCFALSLLVCLYPFLRKLTGIKPYQLAPDMPIHQAVDFIVNDSRAQLRSRPKGYDEEIVSKFIWHGEQHNDAIQQVRQRLFLGELRSWGQIQVGEPSAMQFDHVLQEIPADYWREANFRTLFCFHASDYHQTFWINGNISGRTYKTVTLNAAQIATVWPKKPLLRRLLDKIRRRDRLSYRQTYDVH